MARTGMGLSGEQRRLLRWLVDRAYPQGSHLAGEVEAPVELFPAPYGTDHVVRANLRVLVDLDLVRVGDEVPLRVTAAGFEVGR